MPIFDYHCSDCGSTYEVFHKVREKTEDIVCPKCGSVQYTKQMSAPMVSMGGSSSSESSSGSFGGGGCASGMCGLN
jgi:putative FmdB family regulatory protein